MLDLIAIENFSKRYSKITAVDKLSLTIKSGELFGLIGPDGAGKTTTMRTLCTLLPLEDGQMRIAGFDVRRQVASVRGILGYMPQRFSLYPDLSIEQNLMFFADLFGVPEAEKKKRLPQLYQFSKLEPYGIFIVLALWFTGIASYIIGPLQALIKMIISLLLIPFGGLL